MAFVFDLQGLADILQRRARKQSKSPRSNEVMFDLGFGAEKVRKDKLHRRGKKEKQETPEHSLAGFSQQCHAV